MALPELGTYFWVTEDDDAWFPYKLQDFVGDDALLVSVAGKEVTLPKSKVSSLQSVHPSCLKGLDDMVHLGDLHEAGLLHTIRDRFETDRIYTYTGAILVSVNPYQGLPIYTNEIMHSYRGQRIGSLPPHIFAIADNAYRNMCENDADQSVIISGESGAGKTEATKLILQYLAAVSGHHSWVEQQILDSSPVLEAFGNAKTIRNDNSSRFGKFIEIHFDEANKICGASIINYLLEKSRIVFQAQDERNYHIFYQLIAGATEEERAKYKILSVREYRYLNQSGCYTIDRVNDAEEFGRVKMALSVLNMSDDEIDAIFRILSGILMTGNVEFKASSDGESCSIVNPEVAKTAASIFGTNPQVFVSALTNRTNVIAGNAITVPLKANEAVEGRDAFAKSIYGRMFDWIVSRINDSIRQGKKKTLIGVLDIFGFEIFKQNSFEQFCINFANEKLQQHFNQFIFKTEQEEYTKEKINWSNIEFVDNQDCIDLVEKKPLGLVYLIDEVCKAPKGGDQMMLEKFHKNHEKNPYYEKPRVSNGTFGVKHYAGSVLYNVDGFTDKNKDTLYFDYIESMQMSSSDSVRALFPEDNPKTKDKEKKRAPPTKQTVAYYFKDQLTSLMSTLNSTQPHYVRCLKPNTTKTPRKIDSSFLLRQLRYAGMIEAVRIRRLGFPVRRSPQEFINRFWMIGSRKAENEAAHCRSIFSNLGIDPKTWQIGETKIFLQEPTYLLLENTRASKMKAAAQKIQGFWRSRKQSRYFKLLIRAVKKLQPRIRGWLGRKKFAALWQERDQIRSKAEASLLMAEDRYCKGVWGELMRIEKERQANERQMLKNEEKFQREISLALVKIERIRQFNETKRLRQEEIYQIQVMISIEQEVAREKAKKEAEEQMKRRAEAERIEQERKKAEAAEKARKDAEMAEKKRKELEEAAERKRKELEEQKKKEALEAETTKAQEKSPQQPTPTQETKKVELNTAPVQAPPPEPAVDDDFASIDKALQELIMDTEMQKQSLNESISSVSQIAEVLPANVPTLAAVVPVVPKDAPESTVHLAKEEPKDDTSQTNEKSIDKQSKLPSFKLPPPMEKEPPSHLMNRLAAMDDLGDLDSILNELEGEKAEIEKKLADVHIPVEIPKVRRPTIVAPSLRNSIAIESIAITEMEELFIPEPGSFVRALFDYNNDDAGFLPLKAGDIIVIIQSDESGWCRGECKSNVGWFPLEYVEETEEDELPEDSHVEEEHIPTGQVVRALFDFVGADSTQLSFKKGDIIKIVENDESGWCQGMVGEDCGWFPYDYVEPVDESDLKGVDAINASPAKEDSSSIYVESSIEISLPKDIHKYSFEEFARKAFAQQRTGTFRKKTIEAVDLTFFSKEPLKAPLLSGHLPDHIDPLLQISHSIMKYMGDYSSKKDPMEILTHIISSGLEHDIYRDEIYCNLCKQLTSNPNTESAILGWELLSICIGSFPPSKRFEFPLKHFLRQFSRISGTIGDYATFCQRTFARILVNGARLFMPTQKELQSIRKKEPNLSKVYFVDGESRDIIIEQQTTAREVVMNICKRVGIKAHPAFCLYESINNAETLIKPTQLIADVIAKWECDGVTEAKFVFKNLLYLKSFNEARDDGLTNILYKQAVLSVLNETYTCTSDEITVLAALQSMIEIGTTKLTLAQLIGNNPKKILPAKIAASKTPAEWVKLISDKFNTLTAEGKSSRNAKEAYLSICKRWPHFGMAFYAMEQSIAVGNIPIKFILGVNHEGVHFLETGTKTSLKMLRYGDVTNWGFSASTFVIITGDLRNQQKFMLKTKQGIEISELVQSYINCIAE